LTSFELHVYIFRSLIYKFKPFHRQRRVGRLGSHPSLTINSHALTRLLHFHHPLANIMDKFKFPSHDTGSDGSSEPVSSSEASPEVRSPNFQSRNRGIVVFSGGSAANSLVDVFNTVSSEKDCSLSYVIPISDNGGSSSELIRVFGGPGMPHVFPLHVTNMGRNWRS
jgi:hypothetical protein